MNLRAKRLVRTPHSEQYALFDLDRTDENYDPLSVGKLDLHYTEQGIYGTFLFWQEACEGYLRADALKLAESFLVEFNSPIGVPGEYAVEFFCPTLKGYELLSNIEPGENTVTNAEEAQAPDDLNKAENHEADQEWHGSTRSFRLVDEEDLDEKGSRRADEDRYDEADDLPGLRGRSGLHRQVVWQEEEEECSQGTCRSERAGNARAVADLG